MNYWYFSIYDIWDFVCYLDISVIMNAKNDRTTKRCTAYAEQIHLKETFGCVILFQWAFRISSDKIHKCWNFKKCESVGVRARTRVALVHNGFTFLAYVGSTL